MSVSLTVYVGPYVECRGRPKKSRDDIADEINEDLFAANTVPVDYGPDCWLPNKIVGGRRFGREARTEVIVVSPANLGGEPDDFVAAFQDAIEILGVNYGPGNVAVRWGVVPYWI